ncbi:MULTISPECIES: hypothetical protein [unclassified Microcoleus]
MNRQDACSTKDKFSRFTGILLTMVQYLSSKVLRAHPTIIDCQLTLVA